MRGVWVWVVLAGLCPGVVKSVAADEVADHKAFMALRQRLRQVEQQNPKDAVAQYGAFLQQHADLSPWVGVIVCSVVTDLHHKGLKDAKTALETCDWAAKKYAAHPAVIAIHVDKARVLVAEKRGAEAEALLKEQWERIVQARGNHANAAIWEYCAALEQQGKTDEVIALLKKSLLAIPALLDDNQQTNRGWIYERLADTLIKQKAFDEALQWGKVRFIEAPFDEASIQRSTRMLSRIWAAKDPAAPTARGFFEALTDPARPNPLAEVKLPPVDAEVRTAQLSRLQGGWRQVHERISLQILAGELGPAMMDARQLMVDKPELPAGVQEVCRVLKAADLNLKRANQFIEFVKTGTGANPLEEFLKEQEQKGGVKAGARQPLGKKEWAAVRRHAAGIRLVVRPVPPATGAGAVAGLPRLPAAAVPAPVLLGQPGAGVDVVRPRSAGVPERVIVGVRPVSLTASELPAVVQERALKAPEILAALASGSISPEDAWASGVLTADDLERAVGQVQLGKDYDDRGFHLAGLLAVHFPERVKDPERLSPRVRLRLAGYYRTQRDPRAVGLYEQLLVECRNRPGLIQPALNGLAEYFKATGDLQRAAATYLRAEQVTDEAPVIANALVDAARVYGRLGNERKAVNLYERVPQYRYGWATGVAFVDRAARLMREGRHAEARDLLRRPIEGEHADDVRVLLLSMLARSYYQTGEWQAARHYCGRTNTQFRALTTPLRGEGVQGACTQAQDLLSQIATFERTPLICLPETIAVAVPWCGEPVIRSFWIRSHHPVELSLSCSEPGVKAQASHEWAASDSGEALLRGTVEIPADMLSRDLSLSVTVSSPAYRGLDAHVQIRVTVADPIVASPRGLLFGQDGKDWITERTLKLNAPFPFRVVQVRTDNFVECSGRSTDPTQPARGHELRFRICDVGGRREPFAGAIRIDTDWAKQRAMEVAYVITPR